MTWCTAGMQVAWQRENGTQALGQKVEGIITKSGNEGLMWDISTTGVTGSRLCSRKFTLQHGD